MSSVPHPSVLASMPHTPERTVSLESRSAGVPWYIWTGVAGITSAFIGAEWDVSWHRSIGRDSFCSDCVHRWVSFLRAGAALR